MNILVLKTQCLGVEPSVCTGFTHIWLKIVERLQRNIKQRPCRNYKYPGLASCSVKKHLISHKMQVWRCTKMLADKKGPAKHLRGLKEKIVDRCIEFSIN